MNTTAELAYGHGFYTTEVSRLQERIWGLESRVAQLEAALDEIKTDGLVRCAVPGCSNLLFERAGLGHSTCSSQCSAWLKAHRDQGRLVPVGVNDERRRRA